MTTPSIPDMAGSLIVTAGQAIRNGAAPDDVYRQRLATCYSCEHFIHETKRCSKCGCYMVAKARVGGNPANLCPMKLWQR
jgi:hypothetical protein